MSKEKIKPINTEQFYKEIMEEGKCTFEEAVEVVLKLQEEGKIEIVDYDAFGNPTKFWRTDRKPREAKEK